MGAFCLRWFDNESGLSNLQLGMQGGCNPLKLPLSNLILLDGTCKSPRKLWKTNTLDMHFRSAPSATTSTAASTVDENETPYKHTINVEDL